MSKIREAHESYTTLNVLKRIEEENQHTGENFEIIKESTERIKASITTQEDISSSLAESKSQLFWMKVTANQEEIIFKGGLLFYILVIIYIILTRTVIAWFFAAEQK
ncbi:hypothetical protein EIN_096880 [Entamoeba invadens IP1]|uniref:Uncharacterized protein n=1 Tax=Entamoeba invadens IP1 TaxID=370355 RepID=A0A0A1U6I6_ENTIV|nr:hypothetical protein EIN_096880 [Entamoeba invadens IP1]ELP87421.1 hypothetical protein EIN_096880 [Entamoeba invadens IP1]|eukprot:XP_004254192.1 hypothetical protein EIN_096880 [Entamoeba invadens IP1]